MAKYKFFISRQVIIEEHYAVEADTFDQACDKVWEEDLLPYVTDWVDQCGLWFEYRREELE